MGISKNRSAPKFTLSDWKEMCEKYHRNDFPNHTTDYYTNQHEFSKFCLEYLGDSCGECGKANNKTEYGAWINFLITVSFSVNCVLALLKLFGSIVSGSMSIIASTVDSFLDIISGGVLWVSNRSMRKTDSFTFPVGKTRLEPLSVIAFSILMAMASVLVMQESIIRFAEGLGDEKPSINVDLWLSISLSIAVASKAILATLCYRFRTYASIEALFMDHRNDVVTNLVSVAAAVVASREPSLWFFDPIAATVLSALLIWIWTSTAREKISDIVGKSASPLMLNSLAFVSAHHNPLVQQVDTVRDYHLGSKMYAEIHVALDHHTPLKVAHDIGDTLCHKIESLEGIERAFIHLDYETTHHPSSEHKEIV